MQCPEARDGSRDPVKCIYALQRHIAFLALAIVSCGLGSFLWQCRKARGLLEEIARAFKNTSFEGYFSTIVAFLRVFCTLTPLERSITTKMHNPIDLPLDVKALIFGNIGRHTDLKSLYLTCKHIYGIIIPRIYRSITLSGQIQIPVLCALLNPENKGLQHVRHLNVTGNPSKTQLDRATYDNILHMLANQLPRDTLTSFKYVPWGNMLSDLVLTRCRTEAVPNLPTDIQRTLHQRQQKLYTLRFDFLSMGIRWNQPRGINTDSISTVQVLINNYTLLPYIQRCMIATRRLQCLEIHVDMEMYYISRSLKVDNEHHRATASDKIMAAVIGDNDEEASDSDSSSTPGPKLDCGALRTIRVYGMNSMGAAAQLV